MKKQSKIITLVCSVLMLALCFAAFAVFAAASDAVYTADTDYTPVQMWSDGYSSPKNLSSSGDMSSYLSYLHDLGDNKALAIAPGIDGKAGSHVYLSYRSDVAGSDRVIYLGKTGAVAPDAACTTDFATLDLDLGALSGIPDGMSISFNSRVFTGGAVENGANFTSSPSGTAYIFLRDSNGTLEVSGLPNSGYVDTGIDLSESFAHITFVLDLREVASEGADAIKAYAYVNGKLACEIPHTYTDTTDVINEIRVQLTGDVKTAQKSDTILLDNLNVRAFRTGEYTGNLGGVLENSSKTLADFDKNVFTDSYALPSPSEMRIAKIGTTSYTSYADIIKDAKSGDTVRFLAATGTRPTNLAASAINYVNASTGLQNDGTLYATFDKSGALIKNYTSAADFTAAVRSLQIIGGTIELYGNVTSSAKIFSETTANDGTDLGEAGKQTVTDVKFSLNGYTLSPEIVSWLDIATQQGIKNLEFVGPGKITSTKTNLFNIGNGTYKSTVRFTDVSVSVPHSFIAGQSGTYTFEGCDITWTTDRSGDSLGFISNLGGPANGAFKPSVNFRNCYIYHDATVTPNTTRAPFISTQSIKSTAKANPITTTVNIENCEVDIVNNLWFANANNGTNNTPNMLQPTPTLNIVNSNIKAYFLGSAYNGNYLTINVLGNTNLTLTDSKLAFPSGSKTITYSDGTSATYTSTVIVNLGEGVALNKKPASSGSTLKVNTDGKLLALANGKGYIVENPTLKANISLNSDFNFNFYVPKETFVSASVDGVKLKTDGEFYYDGVTYVKVVYESIAPAAAGVSKSAAITLSSHGREYVAKYSASVPKYTKLVYHGLDGRADALLASIARYIDAAYTYFGSTEGSDAVAEIMTLTGGTAVSPLDTDTLTAIGTMDNLSYALSAATLALESTPTVRFIIAQGFTGSLTIDGKEYAVTNGLYEGADHIDIPLSAKNITKTVTVISGTDRGQFNTVSYYNYLKAQASTDEAAARAVPVVEALFVYGREAGSYVDHVLESNWSYNDTHHWHGCTDSGCIITKDLAEHVFGDDGLCECGYMVPLTDGEGEFLNALGINKTVKTNLEDMKFAKALENTSVSYSFSTQEGANVNAGDMLLFSFVVRADVSTPINVTVNVGTNMNHQTNSKTMTYYAPAQWTRIYMPIENAGMVSVTLETSGTVYIAEAKYENRGDATQEDLQLESGMWMLEDFETYDVSADKLGAGKTIDVARFGDYIYGIGDGKLSVIDTKTDRVVGTLSGFGVLRQIAVTDNGKYVFITGRHNGAYVVDVENPAAPRFVSSYNSIEMATGLYISGDYAFICNRQYGVEVVDISNPEEPKHLANIHSGEVQSCAVRNNILYAGVWSECGVYMYDLSKITESSTIETIGKITTDGKGDGMSLIERDGRIYLFAATGHHTYSASTSSPLDNLCYGQGNGMDIYDVTDPANPKWLSTAKIDGRYYYTANDYWETEVGYDEENDKYYAYLVNTYNGVYVFDVTNLSAPVRLAKAEIVLPLGSSTPALTHTSRAIITPWDQSVSNRGPVGAILISDGKLYIAGTDSDIHVLENDSLIFGHKEENTTSASLDNIVDSFYDFDNTLSGGSISSLANGSFVQYKTEGQALGAVTYGNYLYVAAGAEGVVILGKATLAKVGTIAPTSVSGRVGFASGIDAADGKLYVAEDVAGLRVYDISGEKATAPTLLWRYNTGSEIARDVVLSPGAIFSLVAYSTNRLWVINNETHTAVKSFKTSGTMYHHNISSVIDDRYVCIFGHSGDEHWIDFGPADARLDVPTEVVFTGGLGMVGNVTEVTVDGTNYALKITGGKGVYTNDFTSNNGTRISGVSCNGKPTVCGNYLFVAERISSKVYIYDISYLTDANSTKTAAVLIGTLIFNGNPDIIWADGETVYIPLGYQGIIKIDTSAAFDSNKDA